MSFAEIYVDERYSGPPGYANGGWLAGQLSRLVPGQVSTVSLWRPVPVGELLSVRPTTEGAVLSIRGELLATAAAAEWPPDLAPVEPVRLDEAEWASQSSQRHHPFPTCFVCGPERPIGEGLRILPGPLGDDHGFVHAATWKVGDRYDSGQGAAVVPAMWAALDCVGAFPHLDDGQMAVLGRMTARVLEPAWVGETYAVVGRADGAERRKRFSSTALFDGSGRRVAESHQLWIGLDPV